MSGLRSWLRPAIIGVCGLVLLGGGAYAVATSGGSEDGGQTLVPAEDVDDGTASTSPFDDGDRSAGQAAGVQDDDDGREGLTTGDLDSSETVAGADAAGALPDNAPESYWGVLAGTYDLVEIESRTGRILTNLGGWGAPTDVGEGELIQALDSVDPSVDGSLFVDDCCEPAFGNVYRLEPGETFDPETNVRRMGLNPVVSPSGGLVMLNIGGLLQIVEVDFPNDSQETVFELGEIDAPDGRQFVPLAWIDEGTIAVRILGLKAEEVRIYDVGSAGLVERRAARRLVPDRFHIDAATRSDGRLVVASRLPNGDPLGLARDGDLIAEVIDPETGLVVADFDLPDMIFDIDYDRSGTYLMTSGDDGIVRWYGAGQSGVLAEGVLYASWL